MKEYPLYYRGRQLRTYEYVSADISGELCFCTDAVRKYVELPAKRYRHTAQPHVWIVFTKRRVSPNCFEFYEDVADRFGMAPPIIKIKDVRGEYLLTSTRRTMADLLEQGYRYFHIEYEG